MSYLVWDKRYDAQAMSDKIAANRDVWRTPQNQKNGRVCPSFWEQWHPPKLLSDGRWAVPQPPMKHMDGVSGWTRITDDEFESLKPEFPGL